MDKLKWIFELVDGISGPAKRIKSSLGSVSGGFSSSMKSVRGWIGGLGAGLAKFGLIAQGVQAVGGAVKEAATEALDFGKFVVEAASFKRNTLAAFELMEGSADQAKKTWDVVKAFSDKTPFETSDVMDQFKALRGAGFETRQAEDVLAGIYDVASMQGKGGKDAAVRMVQAIGKLKGTDRADMETLKAIAEASGGGVNIGDVYNAVARARKISKDKAKALVSSGKVGGNEATEAILDVIQTKIDKGGPLGKATELFGTKSWEGATSTFKSRIASLFENVNIQPLIDAVTKVNDLLSGDSETGQALRRLIGAFSEKVGAGISALLSSDNLKSAFGFIVDALDVAYGIIVAAWPYLKALGGGLWDGLKSALGPLLESLQKSFGGADSSIANPKVIEGITAVGKAIGWLLGLVVDSAAIFVKMNLYATGAVLWLVGFIKGHFDAVKLVVEALLAPVIAFVAIMVGIGALLAAPFVALGVAIYGAFEFITGKGDEFVKTLSGWVDSFEDIGKSLVEGIWTGIKDGWDDLVGNTKKLSVGLPEAVKDQLGIHSPSRVFAEIGRNTMLGFEVGVREQAANTNDTVRDAVVVPSAAKLTGGRGGVRIEKIEIHVDGANADNPGELAAAIRRELEVSLPSLLDGAAIEVAA